MLSRISCVPVDPPPDPVSRRDAWLFVIESLVGGLDDAGIVKWIDTHGPDLDAMLREARRLRDGMVAT